MLLRRLLLALTLFALLLAPVAMMGDHAAMAAPAPVAAEQSHEMMTAGSGHCADSQRPVGGDVGPAVDCMVACACVPSFAAPVTEPPTVPQMAPTVASIDAVAGLNAQAEPPPPRLS